MFYNVFIVTENKRAIMAYIDQSEKKTISTNMTPILKKYGLKGTLSIQHHNKLVLTIRSGKIDFIANFNKTNENNPRFNFVEDSLDVNEYWYKEHFSGDALEALSEIIPAMYTDDWYDRSDIMSDYFDTKYYIDVRIGTWEKPYIVI